MQISPQDMPDKRSDSGALLGVVPDGEQILEVETAASNVEELASEAAEVLGALDMHEAEGEDVRVASGFGETMGRDIAELLKLEVKCPFPTNSSEVFPELCWAISSAFLQLVYWDLLVFYCYLIGWVK